MDEEKKLVEGALEGVSGGFTPPGNLGYLYKCPSCNFVKSYYRAQGEEKPIRCPRCGQADMEEYSIDKRFLV